MDEATHTLIELLAGRDGSDLKEWLKQHPQIKTFTRDRATVYAKVIAEELPDVMQIVDRFHLKVALCLSIR